MKENTEIIFLLRGENIEGEPYYCYLAVDVEKIEKFSAVLSSEGDLDPELYGRIVADGVGNPPSVIEEKIKSHYASVTEIRDLLHEVIAT